MLETYTSLTAKQKKVYSVIETYINENGIPPTVREIGELVGEKTPGAVQGILNRLEQKGAIKRQLGAARSIQLISSDDQMYAKPVFVPEIKKISKRNVDDLFNIYNIEKYHPLSPDILSDNDSHFLFDCPSDGLEESGFGHDDMILVNTKAELKSGDIVLVFFETHSLLRYYYPENDGTLTLKADSSIFDKESFKPDEVQIVGKVVGRYTRV
ncbi:MAG: LexA family transcriptional regulator [Clostridiaceae bacterium]|jgi:repressor LexA|nr:LexA family transcriptional regulator [Clostridiaceae bacterium]